MRWVALGLAGVSAVTGIFAAFFWYVASRVDFVPHYFIDGHLVPVETEDTAAWLGAVRSTLAKSGRLNRIAAAWTAASVLCAGLSSLAGAFTASN